MSVSSKVTCFALTIASLIPLLIIGFGFHQARAIMITDSIPRVLPLVITSAIAYFLIFTIVGIKALADFQWLRILWLFSVVASISSCKFAFPEVYEHYLFLKHGTVYHAEVSIDQIARVVDRSGIKYYAEIYPNQINAMIQVNKSVFDRWQQATATYKEVVDSGEPRPLCAINVTMERAKNGARRILNDHLITEHDIKSCRSPGG